MPAERTYTISLELSTGYCLKLEMSSEGMTPVEEMRQAAESLVALYLTLKEEYEGKPQGVTLN